MRQQSQPHQELAQEQEEWDCTCRVPLLGLPESEGRQGKSPFHLMFLLAEHGAQVRREIWIMTQPRSTESWLGLGGTGTHPLQVLFVLQLAPGQAVSQSV